MLPSMMVNRLFLPSLLLFLLVLALVGYMWSQSLRVQQTELADSISQSTASFLDTAEKMIRSAARAAKDAGEKELEFFLVNTREGFTYFDALYILDDNGIVLFSAPLKPSMRGFDMSADPLLQGIREGEDFVVSRPFFSLRTGEPTLRMAAPVGDGRVMAGELNLKTLRKRAFAIRHESGVSDVVIIDHAGRFLAHPNPELVKQQARYEQLYELEEDESGSRKHTFNSAGQWILCSRSPVGKTDWLVLVQTPVSVIYRPLLHFAVPAILFYAAGWLFVFLSFRKKFVHRIVTPLMKLSDTASSIAAGNIFETAEIENEDEIGTVAAAFNVMAKKLRLDIEIEKLAAAVSNIFMELDPERIDEGVGSVIQKVADFLGADRGYVVFLSEGSVSIRKTFLWQKEGFEQGGAEEFAFSGEFMERVLPSIKRLDVLYLTKAGFARSSEKNVDASSASKIQTVLCVPMIRGKTLKGFMGFDSADEEKRWTLEELRLPFIAAKIACNSLERIKTQIALRQARDELEERVRERTAELALAKDEAESANRARNAFLANMTHELRTPMNAILGFTRILADDPLIPPDQKETLRIIKKSAEDLLKMITKILDTTKTETDRVIMEPASFDLRRLVREVDEIMRVQAEYKGLDFSVKSHPDLPFFVKADRNKLREILLNLLSNAVKFTRTGEVSLKVTPLADAFRSFPPGLKFWVSDSGPGIAPEHLDRVFEPFFQVSNDYESIEGSGLGLSICRKFVSLMGGEIGVESEVGKGAVFGFTVPVEPADDSPAGKVPERKRVTGIAPGQTPPGILVAEDDENNRLLLVRILRTAGFATREAKNGLEAVEQCETWKPGMVLMNTKMPVMDGYEAARIIKGGRFGVDKIIAVTAGVLEEKIEKIRASGFDDYIAKPFHENDVYDAIEKHLGIRYNRREEKPGPGEMEGNTDASGILNAETFSGLPMDLLERLERAVSIGSVDMIAKVVEEIRREDEGLARSLEKLTDQFKYEPILTALKAQALHEKSPNFGG